MNFEDENQRMNSGIITEGLDELSPLNIAHLGRQGEAGTRRF